MKTKYTTFNNKVFDDIKEPNTMSLFIYLWSGKFVGIDKDKLPTTMGMSKTAFSKSWKNLTDLGYLHETDKGWTISDEPDPLYNDTNSKPNLFDEVHPLIDWLNKTCPLVQRMPEPLTQNEAVKLMSDFEKQDIKEVFIAMYNDAPTMKKKRSANLTCRNWLSRRDAPKKDAKKKSYTPTAG
jgi:hypothetical protein